MKPTLPSKKENQKKKKKSKERQPGRKENGKEKKAYLPPGSCVMDEEIVA
jgi:hypothetical protein